MKYFGEEYGDTILAANNYGMALNDLRRFEEAKALLRKTIPVARRVLGEGHHITLTSRGVYAQALCYAAGATLDGLREAVNELEDVVRIARRVFGNTHPVVAGFVHQLRAWRSELARRQTPSASLSA